MVSVRHLMPVSRSAAKTSAAPALSSYEVRFSSRRSTTKRTNTGAPGSSVLVTNQVAPLASEAPELLVAGLYAWHLNTTSGLSTLVSSKVNQWTLLVGTLPLVFAVASGTATGLPVGPAQRQELLLTAAQSLFAVAVLVNLEISVREAAALSGLFLVQFALAALVPGATELLALAVTYLALAVVLLLRARRRLGPLVRDGLRTPYHQLTDQPQAAP
jgi:cation:H+ antiporter